MQINSSLKISGIYSIENKNTNRCYVGSSKFIYKRIAHHLWELRNNRHPNIYFQHSFNKHGEGAFEVIILEECLIDELRDKEQVHILSTPKRYNIIDKPTGPLRLPSTKEEIKSKISKANTGKKTLDF